MAFVPLIELNAHNVAGSFREREYAQYFEFSKPTESPFPGFNRKLWVGDSGNYRWVQVMKTVAYVVVDEAADGTAVTETWQIKEVRHYQND